MVFQTPSMGMNSGEYCGSRKSSIRWRRNDGFGSRDLPWPARCSCACSCRPHAPSRSESTIATSPRRRFSTKPWLDTSKPFSESVAATTTTPQVHGKDEASALRTDKSTRSSPIRFAASPSAGVKLKSWSGWMTHHPVLVAAARIGSG